MKDYPTVCPYCKIPFAENDNVVLCSECNTPHHILTIAS